MSENSPSRNATLLEQSPFDQALDPNNRPVIDLSKGSHSCGCPGAIHENPECHLPESWTQAEAAAKEVRFALTHYEHNMPEYWVSMTRLPGMQAFYPFHDHGKATEIEGLQLTRDGSPEQAAYLEDYLDAKNVEPAFKKFWSTFMPNAPQTGAVFVYYGLVNDTEVVYLRYQQDHVHPMVFVLPRNEFTYFLRGWTEAITSEHMQTEMEDWCKHPTEYTDLQKKGYRYNTSALALVLPLSYYFVDSFGIDPNQYGAMVNGDFKLMDGVQKQFTNRFDRMIAEITQLATTLKDKIKFKDHNLMLAFRANDTFDAITVSLDKIFPKFPEGGQYECGLSPINMADWEGEGENAKVVLRKLIKLNNKINEMVVKIRREVPDSKWCDDRYTALVKERMFASSHFLKELYQANPTDIRPYVEEVANKVLSALNERGGNIGLDLTSWVVYQYSDNAMAPIPLVADGLNFKQELYNQHTERFMEVLYQYLFHVRSPYIRPYVHKIIADKNDGIPVGSIRPVNKEE